MLRQYIDGFVSLTSTGKGDSDRHVMTLFALALASKGKTYVELGVREGTTTLPILAAAKMNEGKLFSVDVDSTQFVCPEELKDHWQFITSDSIQFLDHWDPDTKIDFLYIDDWHSYDHVKRELEIVDRLVGPSSIVLLHDLMWGNHDPFYHCDLTLRNGQWADGGPYRAVSELSPQFWEWSTLPWNNGLTVLRKKYSNKYHSK